MDKTYHDDIATFPELFAGMEQFVDELGTGIRQISFRLAVLAISGSTLILFVLRKSA